MDISNKTLGLLLVAAIVVSIGGTIFSLDRLETISATGYASTTGVGDVNLSVASTVSIALNDTGIDFGACRIETLEVEFDSNLGPTGEDNEYCSANQTLPDSIVVNNDGNVDVKVNASIATAGISALYGTPTTAALSLMSENYTGAPGCFGGTYNGAYLTNFSTAGSPGAIDLCSNLTYDDGTDGMEVSAKFWLSSDAVAAAGTTIDVTFRAEIAP